MTFEEAKKIFLNRGYIEVPGGTYYDGDKWRESIVVISKWLEQESCDDVISREEALQALCKAVHKNDDVIPCSNQIVSCLWSKTKVQDYAEEILKLPSVTPKEKIGHWIGHKEHCEKLGLIPSGLGVYEWCSNCDYGIDVKEWNRNHYNFCPNCGARMVNE